jgi:hypothetical protein
LYSDCKHEVLPVTAGTRLTLAYDVYCCQTTPFVQRDMNLPELQVYQKLAALSQVAAEYVKTLAFGMKHEYSTHHGGSIEAGDLKGIDRVIYRCADFLGLETELQVLVEDDGRGYSQGTPIKIRNLGGSFRIDATTTWTTSRMGAATGTRSTRSRVMISFGVRAPVVVSTEGLMPITGTQWVLSTGFELTPGVFE